MSAASASELDLVKEFRLRRWARQNYVAGEHRSDDWHPIVLEEMRIRDSELTAPTVSEGSSRSFVPLVPTELRRLDEAHNCVGEPNLLNSDSRQPDESLQDSWT